MLTVEFIQIYWLQTLFTTIVSLLTLAVKHLYSKMKKEREERNAQRVAESEEQRILKEGVLALLHDRLYQVCRCHIKNGQITISDLDNLEYLFKGYHALKGNGTIEELYNRCKELPIKIIQDGVHEG